MKNYFVYYKKKGNDNTIFETSVETKGVQDAIKNVREELDDEYAVVSARPELEGFYV